VTGRRRDGAGADGLVVVDKAAGWTSHDAVAKLRGILGTRRVGHSGTLDPDATGILLVGAGRVTRLLRFLTALPKTYTGEVVLGAETSTLDASGEVTATHDMAGVTLAEVEAAAEGFSGEILQVPPMVSALKVDGRRLHELARAGIEVEREARPVTIHALVVAATAEPMIFTLTVTCSSGTYVRTLAADLGTALGGGAHLRNLRRTAIGSFGLAEARSLEAVSTEVAAAGPGVVLLSPAEALRDYPGVTVDDEIATAVGHGKVLGRPDLGLPAAGAGPWAVHALDGRLLAVYEGHRDGVKPSVVLAPASG
jgi:tRNA pseudouridine55 synthase